MPRNPNRDSMGRDPKNTYPRAGQDLTIGPLEADELKSPNRNIGLGDAPYVNKDGGVITFESTGPKVGKGKVPNDVLARYRKFVNHAKTNGLPIPYLEYEGKRYYYQSRGRGLVDLSTKLGAVAAKTAREEAKTPSLKDYTDVFGPEKGPQMYQEEQAALKAIKPGIKGSKTPKGYSRGHIRADAEGGFWHTRNLKLENTVRNAQQRQQVIPKTVEQVLNLHGTTNKEHIALQGPETTPLQRQGLLAGKTNVSRFSLKGIDNVKGFISTQLSNMAAGGFIGGALFEPLMNPDFPTMTNPQRLASTVRSAVVGAITSPLGMIPGAGIVGAVGLAGSQSGSTKGVEDVKYGDERDRGLLNRMFPQIDALEKKWGLDGMRD